MGLAALYKRSRDVGGVGLTYGDRHIGYRIPVEMEGSARQQLDAPNKVAWLLSGVPLSYSASEANQILADLGVHGHVAEHTRRVGRGGQNWIVHLAKDDEVHEDVLQTSHDGRDYFITFAPLRAREQTQRTPVWERVPRKPQARADKSPDRTWASVAKGPIAPARIDPPVNSDLKRRMQTMEQLVTALVTLLQTPGAAPLPPPVLSMLDQLKPREPFMPPSEDSEPPDEDSSQMDDQDEEEASETNFPTLGQKRGPPFSRGSHPKRKCEDPEMPEQLFWGHLEPQSFAHIMWGRVRGDGNCFWRAIGQVLDVPWPQVKEKAFAESERVKPLWLQHFKATEAIWQKLVAVNSPNAYANEACCSLVAAAYKRPVVIVADGNHIFSTWVGDVNQMSWEAALVVRLHSEHYDPMIQDVTMDMQTAMQHAKQLGTTVSLFGGGHPQPHTIATWNVNGLASHLSEALALDDSVILTQETGLTVRAQRRADLAARQADWTLLPGVAVPMEVNRIGRWRASVGQVPGVAFLVRSHLRAGLVECATPGGRWLYRRGRFAWLRLGLTVGHLLVGNVYMPSGHAHGAPADRLACHHALVEEVNAWRQIPIMIGGDWNEDPELNPTLAALHFRGWQCPPLSSPGAHGTYVASGGQTSWLDYWLCSPLLHAVAQQQAFPLAGSGHSPVRAALPRVARADNMFVNPNAPEYCKPSPPPLSCPRIDWVRTCECLQVSIDKGEVEQAWAQWHEAFHHELIDQGAKGPPQPPGQVLWKKRTQKARLTVQGQEDRKQILGMRLVRRLYDYSLTGGSRVRAIIHASAQDICTSLGFEGTPSDLLRDPAGYSAQLREHMRQRAQQAKKKAVYAWQKSLAQKGRPTGKLYRWLRGEQALVSPTLQIDGESVTEMSEILKHHRCYWEQLGCREELGQSTIEEMIPQLGHAEAITAKEVLEAARQLQGHAVAGLDRWSVGAVRGMSEGAADSACGAIHCDRTDTACWPEVGGGCPGGLSPEGPAEST